MKNQELLKLLEQVHEEIGRVKDIDQDDRELLTHLSTDIQSLLGHPGQVREQEPQLGGRLQQAIDRFQVSHPTLTSTLSQLSAVLGNAGI
jgi:hypothetical protein